MVDTSKSTARYDTSVDIKKEKKICQIYKSFFFISSELTPLPRFAKGAGVWGLRRPKGFFVLF